MINTIMVYVGTLIGFISLLFVQPHFLSSKELGLTRLILSFGGILSILFSFGISAITVRFLPKVYNKENRHSGFFGFILLYTTISVVLGIAILLSCKELIFKLYEDSAHDFNANFSFVLLFTIINAYLLGLNSYCIALLKSTLPTFLNDILSRILFIIIIFLHFYGILNLKEFLVSFCMIYAIQVTILLFYIFIIEKPLLITDHGHIRSKIGYKSIFRYGLIVTITAVNSVTLKYIDQMFVGKISLSAVGIYSVAAFIGLIIEIPLNALERIANPVIAHSIANNKYDEIKKIYYRSSRFLSIIGGWLFVLVIASMDNLITFLPLEYNQSSSITIWIAIGALINMITGINYPILLNSDKYIWGAVFTISLIAFTVIGNIILIPQYGMFGAAITACIASTINNGLKYLFIYKRFHLQPFDSNTLKIFLLIISIAIIGYFFKLVTNSVVNIILESLILSIIYIGILFYTKWASDIYNYIPKKIKERFFIS